MQSVCGKGGEGNWRPVQISMEERELAINQLQHLPLCPSQVSTLSETDIVLGSCFFWLAPLQILAWLVPFLPVALSWNIQSQRWLWDHSWDHSSSHCPFLLGCPKSLIGFATKSYGKKTNFWANPIFFSIILITVPNHLTVDWFLFLLSPQEIIT